MISTPIAQSHPQKRTRTSYTEEEIERGLVATALASGNTRMAAQILAGEGLPIPRSTLQSWVNRIHPQATRRSGHGSFPVCASSWPRSTPPPPSATFASSSE